MIYRDDDPPDYPEPPPCPEEGCGGVADPETAEQKDGKIVCKCEECGHEWEIDDDPYDGYEPPEEDYDPGPNTCRNCGEPTDCVYCSDECAPDCAHGNRPGDCDHCDYLSDIAYDSNR